jgi:eukaryotic-like serine/threonine-protein kinase
MGRESLSSFPGNERFEVLAKLGSGGMGVVYSAFDRHRRENVAIKTIEQDDPGALLRLKNEFRSLQDLQHPNLVTLGELFHEHGQWFFSMELIDGVDFISYVRGQHDSASDFPDTIESFDMPSSMDSAVRPRRFQQPTVHECGAQRSEVIGGGHSPSDSSSFDEVRLRACLIQLAEGLGILHAAGRVHRDIKPGNILVEPSGRLVLLDFGLVTHQEPGQMSAEHFFPLGTIGYMSPEQASSQDVTSATDWYGVGVLLYESLTGQLPYSGSAIKVLLDKQIAAAPRPRELEPSVPQDLDDLCVALMDREPLRRPTAEQVLEVVGSEQQRHSARRVAGLALPSTTFFVGRQRELAEMCEAYSAVVGGASASLVVHGLSGLGKSELVRTFTRQVLSQASNTMVLHGRCYERESVPFKAFDGVVDSLSQQLQRRSATELAGLVPHHVSLLLRLFPVLGRVGCFRDAPPTRFEVEDLQEVRSLAFQALRELFSRLAERQIVTVAIDDLQWADEDSKRLLRSLMQPPKAPRIFLLAAMRTTGDAEEARRAVAEMVEAFPEKPQLLALGPLSAEESQQLAQALAVDQQLDESEMSRRLEQIARETAGHPLFIRELVQHAQGLQERETTTGAGEILRLDDALWARINLLDDGAKVLVELVAVAGSPLPQGVIAAAARISEAEMFRQAGRLRAERLLRTGGPHMDHTIEVYHDRVREAVLARVSAPAIRDWHSRLAEALLASARPEAEALTVHLESAGRLAEAAKYAAQAAQRAAEALAFKRAAELYRRALTNWPEPHSDQETEALRQLKVSLGEALANAGRGPESAEAYQLAVVGASAAEALELKRRAAEQMLRSGHVEQGLVAVQEVLGTLGMRLPQSTLGSLFSLLWQRLRLRLRGLGFHLQPQHQIPADAIIQADVCNAMSQGLAMIDTLRGAYFSTRFVALALDLGERSRMIRALWMEASYAANTGLPALYLGRLYAAIESLIEEKDPLTRAYLDSAQGCRAFMAGQWAEALGLFESTEILFTSRGGSVWERTTFRFFILWSLYYLGELDELTRRVMPLHADAVDRGDRYAAAGMFLGLANLAHLNALGASNTRQLIHEATESWTTERYYLRNYHALLAVTQVDLYEGKGAEAHQRLSENWPRLKRSLLLMVPSVRIESDHLRARAALAAAAQLTPGHRGPLLADARRHVRRLTRQKASWARALALPLQAALSAQEQKPEAAIEHMREAVVVLEQQEMKLYAAAARRRLGELLGGDEGAEHCAQADQFLADQRVNEPERMLAMLAPGFDA